MRAFLGLAAASMLMATTASAYNGTVKTVAVTSWSTIDLCPLPTTVTLCDPQCATPTTTPFGNIVYETLSAYQAGQVLTISGTVTTLPQPTTLTLEKTISSLMLVPDSVTDVDYTATAIIDSAVYPTSMTANDGQVVTCQTGVTTITEDEVILTNCPCTVQSTVLEITATGAGALPTALVPSTNYVVQIIYVYVVEHVVEQVPTAITSTVTSTLTTIQTETGAATSNSEAIQPGTSTASATTTTPRPTIVTTESVTFLLEYDTAYDGSALNGLRKRQASSLPGVAADLMACLSRINKLIGVDKILSTSTDLVNNTVFRISRAIRVNTPISINKAFPLELEKRLVSNFQLVFDLDNLESKQQIELECNCSSGDPTFDLFNTAEYERDADDFCSFYISIPAVTVTESLTSTTYRISNTTVTYTLSSTTTEQLPDTTTTSISTTTATDIDTETITTTVLAPPLSYGPRKRRSAAPEVVTSLATPFASRVATIPAAAISSACSCIQSRIPRSTSTTTVEQRLTLAGMNATLTSTVQEVFTTQTQSTVTEASVLTTFTTATTTATLTYETCIPDGGTCEFENVALCCGGICASAGTLEN
ncbi:hypothetical protein E4T49_02214 [Aureobasidium sp. EXF-10728]|nr:hypothetical protein E4T49_02214 [Aureobasidium sp. EXF-10728]